MAARRAVPPCDCGAAVLGDVAVPDVLAPSVDLLGSALREPQPA